MAKLLNLLRLYRADAAIITFFSFMFGAYLSGRQFTGHVFLVGAMISLVSVNFIYSVNSWFDRDIDAVNKPHRVLPSGGLSPALSKSYIVLLFAVSVVYPFLLHVSFTTRLLFLIFPLLGLLYSNPWFPFKKISLLSVTTTAAILVLPMLVGAEITEAFSLPYLKIITTVFLYCLFTIPLKDIEDIKGDTQYQSQNWAATAGTSKLVKICAACQALLAMAALIFLYKPLNIFLAGMSLVSFLVIMIFVIFNLDLTRLYRTIIRTIIVCGVIFFLLSSVLKLV